MTHESRLYKITVKDNIKLVIALVTDFTLLRIWLLKQGTHKLMIIVISQTKSSVFIL